jgi:AcrR family transcriptional regulator
MPAPGKQERRTSSGRTYRSPLRERQREQTRAAVIDAAGTRFVEQGYAATSIAEIARTAGVSPETVYATFGSKRELLRAVVHAAATGMVEGGMVVGPELLERVRAEPDARRRLELMGEATSEAMRRVGPLDEVVRAAAAGDPEIAALAVEQDAQKLRDVRHLVALLADAGPLRMPERDATDVVWALSQSTGLYRSLTVDRGWSHPRAFRALNDAIARAVLAD